MIVSAAVCLLFLVYLSYFQASIVVGFLHFIFANLDGHTEDKNTHTHARSYTRIEMLDNITQCKYLATMMNEESDKLAYTATTIKLTFEIL